MKELFITDVGRLKINEILEEKYAAGFTLDALTPYLFRTHEIVKHPGSNETWSQAQGYTIVMSREVSVKRK